MLINSRQAGEILGLGVQSVYKSQHLKAYPTDKGKPRYKLEEVVKLAIQWATDYERKAADIREKVAALKVSV